MSTERFTPSPIRFRVWDHNRKEWRRPEGLSIVFINGAAEVGAVLFDDIAGDEGIPYTPEADGISIVLSTGLHDADGRVIFEGDTVEYDRVYYVVGRHPYRGDFSLRHLDGPWGERLSDLTKTYAVRVVGNVYEGYREPAV